MKVRNAILVFIFCLLFINCKNKKEEFYSSSPSEIIQNFETYWDYTYRNIHLNRSFIGFDAAGNKISRIDFINLIALGGHFAVRLKDENMQNVYKLFPFQISHNSSIKEVSKNTGVTAYENYMEEGKQIENLNLPDIQGKVVNFEELRGQVIVLKF